MLSPKPWKLHALIRLLVSVVVCIFCGSLVLSALQFKASARVSVAKFAGLCGASIFFLLFALVLLVRPWSWERLRRRIFLLLVSLYAGLILQAVAQNLAGPLPTGGSVTQILVATISFP